MVICLVLPSQLKFKHLDVFYFVPYRFMPRSRNSEKEAKKGLSVLSHFLLTLP